MPDGTSSRRLTLAGGHRPDLDEVHADEYRPQERRVWLRATPDAVRSIFPRQQRRKQRCLTERRLFV